MNSKGKTDKKLVTVPKSGLLSLVAAKLKNRVLFPEKVERAKKYLQQAEASGS